MTSTQISNSTQSQIATAVGNSLKVLEQLRLTSDAERQPEPMSPQDPGPGPAIDEAISIVRRVAEQYKLEQLAKPTLRELSRKLDRHPTWRQTLLQMHEAYKNIVGEALTKRPFIDRGSFTSEFRQIQERENRKGIGMSYSETFALLHRQGFLERSGTLERASYRFAPNVGRLLRPSPQ